MKLQVTGSRDAWTYAVLSDEGRAVWRVGTFPTKKIAEDLGYAALDKEEREVESKAKKKAKK